MTVAPARRVVPAAPRLAARAAAERRERRRTRARRLGWLALALVPFAFAAWLLGASSLLAVQRVVVVGEARLQVAQVTAAASVRPGTPLARVDVAAVAARVRRLAPVASVRVTREWPHVLRIAVVERVPVAALADGPRVLLVDAGGALVGPAPSLPRGLLTLRVPGPGTPAARAALAVLRALPPGLRGRLAAVVAPGPEEVELLLRDGRQVVWGSAGSAAEQAEKVQATLALLALPGRVLDVSSPGVVTRR